MTVLLLHNPYREEPLLRSAAAAHVPEQGRGTRAVPQAITRTGTRQHGCRKAALIQSFPLSLKTLTSMAGDQNWSPPAGRQGWH